MSLSPLPEESLKEQGWTKREAFRSSPWNSFPWRIAAAGRRHSHDPTVRHATIRDISVSRRRWSSLPTRPADKFVASELPARRTRRSVPLYIHHGPRLYRRTSIKTRTMESVSVRSGMVSLIRTAATVFALPPYHRADRWRRRQQRFKRVDGIPVEQPFPIIFDGQHDEKRMSEWHPRTVTSSELTAYSRLQER